MEGRSKHLMPERYYYYIAMGMNVVLRWIWIVKLALVGKLEESDVQTGVVGDNVLLLTFGTIEIVRRGVWNIFRMENEQLNNCGKFRLV